MKNQTPLVTVPSPSSLRKHAFYGILALVSLLGLSMTQSASAYLVTLEQVGTNVVATGSGALNFIGLTETDFVIEQSRINPGQGTILTGLQSTTLFEDVFTGSITGPTSFGSGGLTNASSGQSGFLVGINGTLDQIFLPGGVSNIQDLSGTATYSNTTFAGLGVTPGTYTWTWGTGANQNFTLQIGPAGVPDTGSTLSLLSLASLGLVALRRKLRC